MQERREDRDQSVAVSQFHTESANVFLLRVVAVWKGSACISANTAVF